MQQSTFLKIVRYSAIYDLVVTFPFALPLVAGLHINFLRTIHDWLGLSGTIPAFLPTHLFFVNLMGSLVVVWSALRIYKPQIIYGLFDGVARLLFAFCMSVYLFNGDITSIVWALLIPEAAWCFVQFYGYFKVRDNYEN